MNVAMVSEHASPLAVLGGVDAGGQNVHVAELSAALVRAGHRVRVFTRRDAIDLPQSVVMPSGAIVEHLDAGPPRYVAKDDLSAHMPAFARALAARLEDDPADVLHGHFWMSGMAALEAGTRLGVPVVQTFHALGSEKRRMQGDADTSPTVRVAEEVRVATRADCVIATSSSEVFELRRFGADPRRVRLIPCGVDLAAFERSEALCELPRTATHRIATLSRLVERKGVADVIAALAELPDTELVIAGGPAASELVRDPDARRLIAAAVANGVADRVRLVGRMERCDVPAFLRAADVVVCAGWYEPFGIVPLEAMAAGRPVVATAVGGQNDTVLDEFTGLHVLPGQPRAIARAVRELLDDRTRREALGAAGRERVRQRFTWERVARDTFAVYRALVRTASSEGEGETA